MVRNLGMQILTPLMMELRMNIHFMAFDLLIRFLMHVCALPQLSSKPLMGRGVMEALQSFMPSNEEEMNTSS
jgi:hypothetical protein